MATTPGDFTDAYFAEMEDLEDRHPWTRAMRRLTFDLLAGFTPRRILDAGCGTGGFLREWMQLSPGVSAVGVDFAKPALDRASKRLNADWVQGSAADLPFTPSSFDAIHCADVLQHLSLAETERAFDCFRDLLTPGGALALRVRGTRWLSNSPDVDYSHAFTPSRLRAALESRGFDVRIATRVNAAGSLWAELSGPQAAATAVGGIRREAATTPRARALALLLALERYWIRIGLPVPVGHTIIAVARRR